ncbi:MAG TPA: nucleotide-binding protein [Gemmataceae bacterium]|jgi:hypothetical protein|nr:nucleotide-binding protein [Gemmataceae bacterium]
METPKPAIFIGSSSEGLEVAREIELQLQTVAEPTIWKDGFFTLGSGTLESLVDALGQFDFAIMVLSPDDLLESRAQSYSSPRDNVLFELGLFMGRLGRRRTFIVSEEAANLKLPSDLAGIARATYRHRQNLSAALSPACTPIIKAIQSLGQLPGRANVPPTFSGQWEDLDCSPRYVLSLEQEGVSVSGSYSWKAGKLKGDIGEHGALDLRWEQNDGKTGGGVLSLATDGQRLDGAWWYDLNSGDARHRPWHFKRLSE